MRYATKTILAALLLAGLIPLGCDHTKSPPSQITIAGGQASSDVSRPVATVAEATRKALTDLKLSIVQYRLEPVSAYVVAYTPSSERVEIDIRRGEKDTHIIVRSQQNERLSAGILAAIHDAL